MKGYGLGNDPGLKATSCPHSPLPAVFSLTNHVDGTSAKEGMTST